MQLVFCLLACFFLMWMQQASVAFSSQRMKSYITTFLKLLNLLRCHKRSSHSPEDDMSNNRSAFLLHLVFIQEKDLPGTVSFSFFFLVWKGIKNNKQLLSIVCRTFFFNCKNYLMEKTFLIFILEKFIFRDV